MIKFECLINNWLRREYCGAELRRVNLILQKVAAARK